MSLDTVYWQELNANEIVDAQNVIIALCEMHKRLTSAQ